MKLILSSLMILSFLNSSPVRAEGTIVGGTVVRAGDTIARRTVGLVMIDERGGAGTCTGTIFSKGGILTAAHCVRGAKHIFVIFSTNGLIDIVKEAAQRKPFQPVGRNYRLAKNFRELKGYSGQAGGDDEFSDLAVITFDGGLPNGYEPAYFLNQADGARFLVPGARLILAGYGITRRGGNDSGTLRAVPVQFAQFSAQRKNMFVMGQPGRDACNGDSGGPAMVSVSGQVYIVGVASRSDCVSTSIYTWVPRENAARVMRTVMGAL